MAYALVLASGKPSAKKSAFPLRQICGWFSGFISAPVRVSFKEIDNGLLLYIITMPHPEIYRIKNRTGKRLTIKKWIKAVKSNNIEKYLLEKPLKEYMEGEWAADGDGYIAESIRRNMHLLFSMEPLRSLEMREMTVTLSGIKKQYIRPNLMTLLRNFRLVNVIGSDAEMDDIWDEFMAETGVPVCITGDFAVLSRSHVWILYDEKDIDYPFNGIKIAACEKNIIYPKYSRQYRIGYAFSRKLLKKLGVTLVQRFNNQLLAEFLLNMVINKKVISIAEAEELLGVKISILSAESLSLYS